MCQLVHKCARYMYSMQVHIYSSLNQSQTSTSLQVQYSSTVDVLVWSMTCINHLKADVDKVGTLFPCGKHPLNSSQIMYLNSYYLKAEIIKGLVSNPATSEYGLDRQKSDQERNSHGWQATDYESQRAAESQRNFIQTYHNSRNNIYGQVLEYKVPTEINYQRSHSSRWFGCARAKRLNRVQSKHVICYVLYWYTRKQVRCQGYQAGPVGFHMSTLETLL